MKREMLINVLQPEECRIAILENGVLEELYVERTGHESYVGNIYKGRIVNIEPSIQAAFVDFGVGRNGFLHVSDVEAAYYRHLTEEKDSRSGRDRDRDRGRPTHVSRPGVAIPSQSQSEEIEEDGNVVVRELEHRETGSEELADKLLDEMEEIADDLETSPALLEMEENDEPTDYAWDNDDDEDEEEEAQHSFGAGIWDDDEDSPFDDEYEQDQADEPEESLFDDDDEYEDDDVANSERELDIAELAMFVTTGQLVPKDTDSDTEADDASEATITEPETTEADENPEDSSLSDETYDDTTVETEEGDANAELAPDPEADNPDADADVDDKEADAEVVEVTPNEEETEVEESKPKRKRATRSKKTSKTTTTKKRTTRSRKKSAEPEEETPTETGESADKAETAETPEPESDQVNDDNDAQPKPMDSAERRTHEDDPELAPLEVSAPSDDEPASVETTSGHESDEDLSATENVTQAQDDAEVDTIAEGTTTEIVDSQEPETDEFSSEEHSNPLFPSEMATAMAESETSIAEPSSEDVNRDFSDIDLSFSMARPQEPQPKVQTMEEEEQPEELANNDTAIEEEVEEAIEVVESDIIEESAGESDEVEETDDEDEEVTVMDLEDAVDDLLDGCEDLEEEQPTRRRERSRGGNNNRRGSNGRRGGRDGGRNGSIRPKPLIQDIFKKGQEVIVQVIKEGIGTKGPTLSTYISIAGRYLVLMPGLNRIGVSRKITDEEQRRRLRDILNDLKPPKGLGFIIRTAGLDRTKKELQRDLAYLSKLWQVVVRRIRKFKAPAEIYQESDMITRTIRDTFTNDIQTIYVDETRAFEHAQEFLQIVMPRYATRIKHYKDSEPIFHKYGIESEIAQIHKRHVPLPNGGSIVIDQTEALVAIDVNSGNFRADNNAEETAYQMNLIAAREIARQLRLRDLGGVIVNDFIDMREERHRRNVERAMREAVRRDRTRTKILKISQFGIVEMTRQRIRPSLKRSVYQDCPHCNGSGQVKTCESMSIEVMRMLQLASTRDTITQIFVRVSNEVANYLHNRKRKSIANVENNSGTTIHVEGVLEVPPEWMEFRCFDNNNNEIHFPPHEEPRSRRRHSDRHARY